MTRELKKILIIANLYHASPRIPRLMKRLPSNGWAPTVITPYDKTDSMRMFNAPPSDLERYAITIVPTGKTHNYEVSKEKTATPRLKGPVNQLLTKIESDPKGWVHESVDRYYWRLYATMNYPDVERKWKIPALEAGRTELRKGGYDVILSSSSPITAHIVGAQLKKEFGVPWIAEYRDPWSLNHNHPLGPLMRSFDRRLERRTIGQADSIVTVTEEWAADLRRMFPHIPVSCLPIGFEAGDLAKVRPTEKFTVTHTGQFYHGKQNPFLFLDAIARLINEDKMDAKKVDVRFYGPHDTALQGHIQHLGLSDVVHQYGVVTRDEAQARQRESQILLMLNWEDRKQSGVSSLKLVEYFSTGRPILNSGGYRESLMAKMVGQTRSGITACSIEEIKETLMEYYAEYIRNGLVEERGDRGEISRYDFDNIAVDYASLLTSVTSPKNV